MAWSLVSTTTASGGANIAVPLGTTDGDLLVFAQQDGYGYQLSTPSGSGWTELDSTDIGSGRKLWTMYKVWHTGDPTIAASNAGTAGVKMIASYRHSSGDGASYDVHATNDGNSASPSVSGITTSENDALLIFVVKSPGNSEPSPPSGWNEAVQYTALSTLGYTSINSDVQATAGSTGTVSGTLSASGEWVAHLAAFVPGGDGGSGTTLTTSGSSAGTSSASSGSTTTGSPIVFTGGTSAGTSSAAAEASITGVPIPLGSAAPTQLYDTVLVPPVTASARLMRTDMSRSFHEPLELAWPYDIEVVCNTSADHTLMASINVVNPDAIRALIDYVELEITIRDIRGKTQVIPMGHYLCDVPERSFDGLKLSGRVIGYGGTLALAQSTMGSDYTLVNEDPAVAMVDVIAGAGIPRDMIDIPPSGIIVTEPVTWYSGDLRQKIVNDMADMIAYYAPWPRTDGVISSIPYLDYATAPITARIGTEPGQLEILGPTTDTRDSMRMVNEVTVRRIVEDEEPIIATARITDYSHPLHPERLQAERNSTMPVILAGDPIDDGMIETYEAALEKARNLLAEGASRYHTTRIRQVLDPAPDAHQIIELDVRHGVSSVYAGRWWRRAWTFRMQGPTASLDAELNHTVGVQ